MHNGHGDYGGGKPSRSTRGAQADYAAERTGTGPYDTGAHVMSGGKKHQRGSAEYNQQVASTIAQTKRNREETIRQQREKDLGYFTKASYVNRSLADT